METISYFASLIEFQDLVFRRIASSLEFQRSTARSDALPKNLQSYPFNLRYLFSKNLQEPKAPTFDASHSGAIVGRSRSQKILSLCSRGAPGLSISDPIRRDRAFTLVELLLVVFIMSSVALMAVTVVENSNDQERFELTRSQLQMLGESVVYRAPSSSGIDRVGGFSVDNGKIPDSIEELLTKPSGYDDYGATSPVFDPSPDPSSGMNNEASYLLDSVGEKLMKGYRAGGYLPAPPSSNVGYYDGWGNVDDPPNFGWIFSNSSNVMTVSSLGRDGVDNNPEEDGYDGDLSLELQPDEWMIDIQSWSIVARNVSGNDLAVAAGGGSGCVRVSLLVYVNDDDDANPFNWKRLTSTCIPGNTAVASDGSCLDGDSDGLVDGVPCPSSAIVSFPASGGFQPSTLIPGGEHLLVLVNDDNATPHDGSAGEEPCLGNTDCVSGSRTAKRVQLLARDMRADVALEIR